MKNIFHVISNPTKNEFLVGEGYSLYTTYTKHFKSDSPLNENLRQRMIHAVTNGLVLEDADLVSVLDPRLVKRTL